MRSGMALYIRDIHIVKDTFAQKLGFSGNGTDFSLIHQLFTVIQFNTLFGGSGDESDFAAHGVKHTGLEQTDCGTDQTCRAGIVTAGMNGAGYFVALGVIGKNQGVQFAQDCQCRTGTSGINIGTEPGYSKICFDLQTEFLQFSSKKF